MKKCTQCKKEKVLEDFYTVPYNGKRYHVGRCKPCTIKHNNALRAAKPKPEKTEHKCHSCGKTKDLDQFSLTTSGNPRNHCKKCRSAANSGLISKGRHLKHRYGLTLKDLDRMIEAQEGKCAICKADNKPLHIDHNHETGKVRALLCGNCNRGLGYLGDSRKNLLAAFNYLEEHGQYGG